MRERTYAYRPSFRNAIFYPLTWKQFLGRSPVTFSSEEIREIHLMFHKVSIRLSSQGMKREILLDQDEPLAQEILNDLPEKILNGGNFWPPALMRNLGSALGAFLILALIYIAVAQWLAWSGGHFFVSRVCLEHCPALMGSGLLAALGSLLFHPFAYGPLAIAIDEILQHVRRDQSGRHLVKVGCAAMVLLFYFGSRSSSQVPPGVKIAGFYESFRQWKLDRIPDFSYLRAESVDFSSKASAD